MARPIKYINTEERLQSAKRTADVLHEIKENSGLTYEGIADFLKGHKIFISAEMLRQYAGAHKIIGERRLTEIAVAASLEGWAGKKCYDVIFISKYYYEGAETLDSLRRDAIRYKQVLVERLLSYVEELIVGGVSAGYIDQIVKEGVRRAEEKLSS